MTVEELHSQLISSNSPIVVDVRSHKEFNKGHIKGALHIPLKLLSNQLSYLTDNKNNQIVVYCYGGPRAKKAIELLRRSGFANPTELKGHFEAWTKAGLPVSK